MSGHVHASRQTADHGNSSRPQVAAEAERDVLRIRRCRPRADDRDSRPLQGAHVASHPQQRRWVLHEAQEHWILRISERNRSSPAGRYQGRSAPGTRLGNRDRTAGVGNATGPEDDVEQRLAIWKRGPCGAFAVDELLEHPCNARPCRGEHRDGNGVFEIHVAYSQALERARGGWVGLKDSRGRATAARATGDRPLTSIIGARAADGQRGGLTARVRRLRICAEGSSKMPVQHGSAVGMSLAPIRRKLVGAPPLQVL